MFESLEAPSLKNEYPWLVTGPVLYSVNINLYHSWMQSATVLPQALIYPVHFLDRRKYMVEMKELINYAQYKDAYVAHVWINIIPWLKFETERKIDIVRNCNHAQY